ncbi:MAG: hypothetical protein IPP57_24675 [Candidatus Obscuribacter sp.]|nr:hypothetical protein [Candidatus Obscuribacter sp.]
MMTPSGTRQKPLLNLLLQNEGDVVLARRRSRQIALLLGFDLHDQTRISTAVSEICRSAIMQGSRGRLTFAIDDTDTPFSFVIVVTNKDNALPENRDLLGASKLVDQFDIQGLETGTTITIRKHMAPRLPFTGNEIEQISESLTKIAAVSVIDEVHQQNQEVLLALEELSAKQKLLDQVNAELETKNQNLAKLNREISELNESLESKVLERTNDLLMTNDALKLARDEAIGANRLKVQFVSNMSHELRTPMAGILGLAEMLAHDEDNSDLVHELAENIMQAGRDLMHIVNDLLDFSKLESGKLKLDIVPFSVAELVAEVAQSISIPARAKGLALTIDIEPTMPAILHGDSMRLKHALQNLAQNALKFTDSGTIAFSAFIDSIHNDLYVIRFGMVDTGIGIDNEQQKQIFEPFVQGDGSNTRKYGGTGLGLSIVKQSVAMMNGHVGIKSAPGEGTEIWFTVPLTLDDKDDNRDTLVVDEDES